MKTRSGFLELRVRHGAIMVTEPPPAGADAKPDTVMLEPSEILDIVQVAVRQGIVLAAEVQAAVAAGGP